MTILNTIYEI